MFDLDEIERDWKENSFCLTDEAIMDIFVQEGVTNEAYQKECDEHFKHRKKINPMDRLLASIFGEEEKKEELDKKEMEYATEFNESIPKRKHLSQESQMKVVEGCMDVVFEDTRYWYEDLDRKISMEKLYNICIDSLIKSAKYCMHYSTKPCFRAYVNKSIKNNISEHIAKWEHITVREADKRIKRHDIFKEDILKLDYDKEIPTKQSYIYEMIKNDSYDVDYTKRLIQEEFMSEYDEILEELPYLEKMVMRLSYDDNGENGLTTNQISDYIGVEPKEVKNAKRRVITKLRKDNRFNKYRKN